MMPYSDFKDFKGRPVLGLECVKRFYLIDWIVDL